jgi:hypothetical protein
MAREAVTRSRRLPDPTQSPVPNPPLAAISKVTPDSAYTALVGGTYRSTSLTRSPRQPEHQHGGPPIALACRAIERAAAQYDLSHISRLTANFLRPVPIGELSVTVTTDYAGRNAGHFSARIVTNGKEVARFTSLVQREIDVKLPDWLPGHSLPTAPRGPDGSPLAIFPFAGKHVDYADLVETRITRGKFFCGPCTVWFRLRRPLVEGETPSAYQRVSVAADSGNCISAILDFAQYTFVNSDLTINLLRQPKGEWICLDARTYIGPTGCGLAESTLYDVYGLIGQATQSLSIRSRR